MEAQNEALMRLLQVLRDRGSISAQEYARDPEGRRIAAEPGDDEPAGRCPSSSESPRRRRPRCDQGTDRRQPAADRRSSAGGKWYERIGLRGYTQFRISDVVSQDEGPALEVPNDRSVNDNESFIIRRGRFVFSGDISDRLSLYAQSDFNASTGAADFSLQMRDLYADVWLDKAKFFRVRAGQSKVPFGWVNMQSSQNRAPLERPDAINSAAEGERDIGATLMWIAGGADDNSFEISRARGLKGTGDYGVVAVGLYAGQGPNRSDQNGQPHVVGTRGLPFKLRPDSFVELGVQAYHGRFVSPTQAFSVMGARVTPTQDRRRRAGPARRIHGRLVSTANRNRDRMDDRPWPGAISGRHSDRVRLAAGGYVQLNYRTQAGPERGFVRHVELLRWRTQVRQKRAAIES